MNFEPQLPENRTLRTSWCRAEPTMSVPTLQVLWILTKFACRQQRYCTIILSKWNSNFSEKVLRHEDFRWLTAHSPILGENNGHPSGLGLFENDIAIVKVNGTLPCKRKEIWPACLPTPVSLHRYSYYNYIFHQLVKYFEIFQGTEYAGWAKTGLAGWGHTIKFGLGGSNSGQS